MNLTKPVETDDADKSVDIPPLIKVRFNRNILINMNCFI